MVIKKGPFCDPTVVQIKCPFKVKNFNPKVAFLLPIAGGKKMKMGIFS